MAKGNRGGKRTSMSGSFVSQQDLSKMTDDELKNLDNQFKTLINVTNDELTRLVNNQTGTQSKEYYGARNQLTDLRNSHRKVIDEIVKRKSENTATNKNFVNSYGEATTRDITTSTYKQLQRKLNKRIMKFIGG